MKNWMLAFILALIAISPVGYIFYFYYPQAMGYPTSPYANIEFQKGGVASLEEGSRLHVLSCSVLDGYRYFLNLEGNHRIEAHLSVATKAEAAYVVVDFLTQADSSQQPVVILRRNIDDKFWIVDLELTFSGKRSTMLDLLEEEDLLIR